MSWEIWTGISFFGVLAAAGIFVAARLHPGFREAVGLTPHAHEPGDQGVEELISPYTEQTSMRFGDKLAVDPAKAVERAREGLERIQLDPDSGGSLSDIARAEDLAAILQMPWVNLLYLRSLIDNASELMQQHNARRYALMTFERFDPEQFGLDREERALRVVTEAFEKRRSKNAELFSDDVEELDAVADDIDQAVFFCLYAVVIFGVMVANTKREAPPQDQS